MGSMFGFFQDADNYDNRKVGRDDFDWGFVSTAAVSDGRNPYETAVEHPEYNAGAMVIVECYPTRIEAELGHARWVKTMQTEPLPAVLQDCQNAWIDSFLSAEDMRFPRTVHEAKP